MANISCVCQTDTKFSIENNADKLTIKLQIHRKGQDKVYNGPRYILLWENCGTSNQEY